MPTRQGDVASAGRPTRLYAVPQPSALEQGEHALFAQGSLRASRTCFEQAYREADAAGCAQAMARAALGMSGLWVHERRLAAEAAAVEARQRRALAQVGADSILGLRLTARLAAEHSYQSGDPSSVLEALDNLRTVDDPTALAEGLSLAHHCLLGPDHAGTRLELAHVLLGVAASSGRSVDVLMGLLWRTVDLFLMGDPTAERSLAELRAVWADGHQAVGFVVRSLDAMLALRAGRWADAETLVAECAERGTTAGDADAATWQVAQLVAIRWFQGRVAETLPAMAELAVSTSTGAVDRASFAALAVALAAAGDRAGASCAVARVRGHGFADLVRSSGWLVAMYGVVEAAYLLGDRHVAVEAYAVLSPFARLPMMTSLAVACFGSTHHALGMAALTQGHAEVAVEHFEAAVRDNLALGHRPAAVLSGHRLAEALDLRGAPGDKELAVVERDRAARAAGELDMRLPARHTGPAALGCGASRPAIMLVRADGATWQVGLGDRVVTVPDALGVRYLAMLVERPGEEVAATELALAAVGRRPGSATGSLAAARVSHPLLDDRATSEYQARVRELTRELDEHEQGGDLGRAEQARAERDWLLSELVAATGLGGRVRMFADDGERARIAVTKAIRRSVARVTAADPVIGAELDKRVQTGKRCCFTAS